MSRLLCLLPLALGGCFGTPDKGAEVEVCPQEDLDRVSEIDARRLDTGCIVLPDSPGVHVVDGGVRRVGEPVCIDVPEVTIGFTVLATHDTSDFSIAELRNPKDEPIIEGALLSGSRHAMRSTRPFSDTCATPVRPAALAVAVPQSSLGLQVIPGLTSPTPALEVEPGRWWLTVKREEDSLGRPENIALRVAVRVGGETDPATVDVNLFRAPAAQTDAYFEDVVEQALERIGLDLGAVSHHELPSSASVISGGEEMFSLFSHTREASLPRTLNIIGVADLGWLSGVAGGIPGVTFEHGMHRSAVLVELTGESDDVFVVAHEIGHFGGLFHTSDDAQLNDPLSDTDRGFANLMTGDTWLQDVDQRDFSLSEQQLAVLRGSMLYDGTLDPQTRPSPNAAATRPGRGAWADRLSEPTRLALGASCARSRAASHPLPFSELKMAAEREDVPVIVRKRALELAGVHGSPRATRWLRSMVSDQHLPRWLRLSALRGLARTGAAAELPSNDPDPVVADLARAFESGRAP